MADDSDRCRLYLVLNCDDALGLSALEAAFAASDVACVLLEAAAADPASARDVVTLSQENNVAVLVADDAALAERIGADGVHASGDKAWRDARDALGSGVIVGGEANGSRHAAMSLAEAGADYVAFSGDDADALIDMVAWWAELFTSPCVAFAGDDADLALSLAEAGADFVAIGGGLWRDAAALAALDAAVTRPREAA